MAAKKTGGRWITKSKRLALYIRDGFTCQYCGTDLRNSPANNVQLDHLEVRLCGKVKKTADGRSINHETNLVTACAACNNGKGARDWRAYATGGAIARIERQRMMPLNLDLAKQILAGYSPED